MGTHKSLSHSLAVGRVGVLAATLGVGAAVVTFAGAASADTGGDSGSTGATRSADSGSTTGKAHADKRRGTPRGGSDASPVPAGSVRSAADNTVSRVAAPARRSAGLPAGVGARVAAPRPAISPLGGQSAGSSLLTSLFGGQGLASSVQSALGDVVTGVLSDILSAVVDGANAGIAEVTSGPVVDPLVAAPEAPVMTAVVQPDALVAAGDPLAVLGGDGGGGPAAEPLAWAALAVSRQEDLAGPTPEVAPTAAVSAAS